MLKKLINRLPGNILSVSILLAHEDIDVLNHGSRGGLAKP